MKTIDTLKLVVLAFTTFAAVGCGAPGADFEGTWTYQDQAVVVSCPGYAPMTQVTKGNDTIVAGTDSDIVLTDTDACNLKFNVQDGVATIVPGQSCANTRSDGNGGTLTLTENPTTFSITLGKDKRSYTEQISGTLVISEGTQSITCSFSGSESATKVGK